MAAREKTLAEPLRDAHTHLHTPPLLVQLAHRVEDVIDEINWFHIALRLCASIYIAFIFWITYLILPFPGHWQRTIQSDKLPTVYQDTSNYFGSFEGFSECDIRASDLYTPPARDEHGLYEHNAFCPNRRKLLQAMSNGGRIGFDAPYTPRDCHLRWYSVAEICMILERFDSLVFVGDFALHTIYSGFNILLRQDLRSGALKSWDMDQTASDECRCNNQFIKQSCAQFLVGSSADVVANTPGKGSAYLCSRRRHALLDVEVSPAPDDSIKDFMRLVPHVPRSNCRPVPIIHSLSPSTVSKEVATKSLLEFLKLADNSKRKTPMLWIGPTAAGHVDIKNRKGNQEIWDFDRAMAKVANDNDIDVLSMWNMTVQAASYDGLRFGEKVALTQAMMVVNWLSRLESS